MELQEHFRCCDLNKRWNVFNEANFNRIIYLELKPMMVHLKQQWRWPKQNVVVSNWFFYAIFAKLSMVHTFDHHDTYYQKHLDLIDEYHHHGHVEYAQQHDQYPTIRPMFVHLKKIKTRFDFFLSSKISLLTSFITDSMSLSFVTSHLIMNEIHDISTNRCTKNGW